MAQDDHMTDETRALRVAARVAAVSQETPDLVTLSNGIVLRVRTVSREALAASTREMIEPVPPTYTDPGTGRPLPNLNDPDYEEKLEHYHLDVLNATWRVMQYLATSFVSVPDGLYGPQDDGWIELAEAAGIKPRLTPGARYVDWLDFCAITNEIDRGTVSAAIIGKSGIQETRVAAAVNFFLRQRERRADLDRAVAQRDSDGDRNGETAPVPRPRVRRARSR